MGDKLQILLAMIGYMLAVILIGLYFAPILCLLGAGWSYVRWKNEHENEALSERAHKNCKRFLIAAPIVFALFLALKFIFPVE